MKKSDGFHYDLYKAMEDGNFFERVFHSRRLSLWKSVDYGGGKVLDVGCNTGVILIPLLEQGVDVVGIDISREDIRKAKRRLKKGGYLTRKVRVADAKKLPFRAGSFDVVILSDVLEHVSDPGKVAKEAVRVVKKGGLVMATVPNEWHPVVRFDWVRKLLTGRDNVDEYPDVPFNAEKLRALFPDCEMVEKKYVGFWTEIFGSFKKP